MLLIFYKEKKKNDSTRWRIICEYCTAAAVAPFKIVRLAAILRDYNTISDLVFNRIHMWCAIRLAIVDRVWPWRETVKGENYASYYVPTSINKKKKNRFKKIAVCLAPMRVYRRTTISL